MCNLGSVNMSRIKDHREMKHISNLCSMFLTCGSLKATLPYEKCYEVRENARKIGVGLMGVHEWLLLNNLPYRACPQLGQMLDAWNSGSELGALEVEQTTGCTSVMKFRAVAPAGTISILAGTTSGIEPLYAVAMKRRYLRKEVWRYQYLIDPTAEYLIAKGIDPDSIETSMDLAKDIQRRLAFQVFVQEYTDMGISSTLNLPAWGTPDNCEDNYTGMKATFLKYLPMLRGVTCYPDGARGGQPLTAVSYEEAKAGEGVEHNELEEFMTTVSCPSGACGI